MTFEEYERTLDSESVPDVTPLLRALWWEKRGDWAQGHEIAQDEPDRDAAWVHAYLHRREGSAGNAAYWYRQAGRPVCTADLDEEWKQIVGELLRAA